MAAPRISPVSTGSPVYTVHDAKALVADLTLDVGITTPFPVVEVRLPAAADAQVNLVRGNVSLPLLPGPVNDSTTFAQRRIVADTTTDGTDLVLGIEIRATAGAVSGETWSVRGEATAPQPVWQFTQGDNTPADPTVTRIMCDPVADFTITAPGLTVGAVSEGTQVTLTAAAAVGTAAAPTVVGSPVPAVARTWSKTGGLAIPSFPTTCSAGPQGVFTTPGVYVEKGIAVSQEVWFETGCAGPVGTLNNTAPPQPLTIKARPQHLALVLDRSGSMQGDRWENAKTAARILGDLFAVMRAGVNPADRIEQLVFEDPSCTWHPVADPIIQPVLAPSDPGSVAGMVCQVDFGPPGSCTPIGDGLIRAIDDLAVLPAGGNPKYTVVLLTDGYENSGSVRVAASTPIPPGVSGIQQFGVARQTGAARQRVNQDLSLYTIGLGPTVQEDVLDTLATQSQGVYRHVVKVSEVADAMAQMVSFSQSTQRVAPDPGTGLTERVVSLDPRVSRLAVAVLWNDPADTVELAWRTQGSGASFTPVAAAVQRCPTHGLASVDLTMLFGTDEDSVPGTEWRIVHVDSAGADLPLPDTDLLVFVDLFVRVDVVFDRDTYGTGDPMVITARLRAGDDPVTNASVTVELTRPKESLGTFLARNGTTFKVSPPRPPDPHAPKAAMLTELLRRHELPGGLPVVEPSAIFEDGSDRLFDDGEHHDGPAGNGDFANRYVELDKEGTYTWRVNVEGRLQDGSRFSRVLTVSKWVGITPDPDKSQVIVGSTTSSRGRLLTEITVYPLDRNGEFLGPFRPDDVLFKSSGCPFRPGREEKQQTSPDGVRYPCRDGGTVLSRYDGGYSRVLMCEKGVESTVAIMVKGVGLAPVVIGGDREVRSES
ncbi:vWA domain-containing protein [Kitasatospora sp. NPDC047058]|uniref:vWA domain-containing protein n=1 Tax=Kitasatospora sp. NPDC047058 TaxID=3155620 RepID=UPI00340EF237